MEAVLGLMQATRPYVDSSKAIRDLAAGWCPQIAPTGSANTVLAFKQW